MKTFGCHCGNTLHFENTRCLSCGRTVAFAPDLTLVVAVETGANGMLQALLPDYPKREYRSCRNEFDFQACNWLVPAQDTHPYCVSCRLNHIVPGLDSPRNRLLWHRVESAKRRLLYSLMSLKLSYIGRDQDPVAGLAFQFLEDLDGNASFAGQPGWREPVLTGHRNGLITINLAEADHAARERMRESLNEGYRTLLGHFRHESGHYFWDHLVRDSAWLASFRDTFGDERIDYACALDHYHGNGPPADWQARYISAYAASHPWEDWAETWAHYLHMIDTLETAKDYGFAIDGRALHGATGNQLIRSGMISDGDDFAQLVEEWVCLTKTMNAINLSMGLKEAYPFTLGAIAIARLRYVHALVRNTAEPE